MRDEDEIDSQFIKPDLSIQECRSILCRDGEQYTDEEIKEIRTLILKFIEIDFHYFNVVQLTKSREQKVIDIEPESQENKPYRKAG